MGGEDRKEERAVTAMSLGLTTRTTRAQMRNIRELMADVPGVIIHKMSHNLDGLWLNIYYTDGNGDWVRSIDRDGNHEETQ